ncbi:uncharacterized protein [Amphiura filiformis]|uniref:uncharacterized protein n=1 Tax=Amphiura filiformis TaxID=82378 RepID=UPI003B223AE0
MNPKDTEYVLKFSCGVNENAAKFVLSHLINMSCELKQSLEASNKVFGIGYLEKYDPWRLPLILLFEAESQFGFNETLHSLMKPLLSNIYYACAGMNISNEYNSVLNYYIDKCRKATVYMVTEAVMADVNSPPLVFVARAPHLNNLTFKYEKFEGVDIPGLSDVDITWLLDQFQSKMTSKSIQVLDFDVCECTVFAIKSFLESQPNLTTLSIPPPPKDEVTHLDILEQVLQEITVRSESVTKLDLKLYHGLHVNEGIPIMCRYVNVLEQLAMDHDMLGRDDIQRGFPVLFEAIRNAGRKLQQGISSHKQLNRDHYVFPNLPLNHLDLSFNNIRDSSYQLAEAMTYLGMLDYLNLRNCMLNEKHFHVLGPAFAHMPNLRELDLSGNVIANSFQAIAQEISHCKLTKLILKNIGIRSCGGLFGIAPAMSVSLQHMPKLEHLDLSDNNIKSVSFQDMPKLTYLNMFNSNFGSDGPQALLASLLYTPQLSRLDVSNNNIGSDGGQALSASLKYIPNLKWLKHVQ